ncbi:succinyl-diaminopimelate desuccinylase [mine drainage metagenome]|uniref:Succinyl-diaminopimelate desuccinylase n=1 Tax=mine drainage metagenome TaxID=410659 RepID=T1ADD7_9ZZZZ
MVDMLAELVKIPSDPFSDKQEVLDYVQSFTDQIHMRNTLFGDAQSPALLAEYGQGGVVLSGHLDTPPIGDYWSFSQSQVASGRLYGRGAADMKGTVVAMLQAAADLVLRKVPVVLAFTTDEETTMQGAAALSKTLPMRRAKAIVVGEPTGLRVAHAEKGVLDIAIETRGKAAHGAMPHLGENAISKMMRIVRGLESFKGRIAHPELGTVTMNLGTFHGGNRLNVVPNKATAEVDIRFPPPYPPISSTGRSRSTCGGSRPRSRCAGSSPFRRSRSIRTLPTFGCFGRSREGRRPSSYTHPRPSITRRSIRAWSSTVPAKRNSPTRRTSTSRLNPSRAPPRSTRSTPSG